MTLRDKIAHTICESRAVDNWLVQARDYELSDAILAVIAESVGELREAAWLHVEEFCVMEDSGQMAARDRLVAALSEIESLGLSTPEQEKGE